jgi:hypothetical protein
MRVKPSNQGSEPSTLRKKFGWLLAVLVPLYLVVASGFGLKAHEAADNFFELYVFEVLRHWALTLTFLVASLSIGLLALRKLFRLELPFGERLMLGLTLGAASWGLGFEVLGALHLLRPEVAVVVPLLYLLAGARDLHRLGEAGSKAWSKRRRLGPLGLLGVGLGTAALLLLYLPALSPGSVCTDAAWFHLHAAEEYARLGKLVAFPGDYAKALPQLTSLIQVWPFLVPGLAETERWVLALHIEFALVFGTLFGVLVLARRLFAQAELPLAFFALFLFPSIYVYDSNLGGSADHIAAFFVIGQVLGLVRFLNVPSRPHAALAGVLAGASLLTKLQGSYVLLPSLAVLVATFAYRVVRTRDWSTLAARATEIVVFGLALTATFSFHLVKNAVFYKNPLYPFLQGVIPSSPSFPDAAQLFREHYPPFEHGPLWPHLKATLELVLTHPWTSTSPHGTHEPFIGMLFILTLPIALVMRNVRLLQVLLIALACIFNWAWSFPTARNLQVFVPLLATVTAVALGFTARLGRFGVLAVTFACATPWAANFDRVVHETLGRADDVFTLARLSKREEREKHNARYRQEFRKIREFIPEGEKALLHTSYSQLGIRRTVVLDWPGFQGNLDYRPAETPQDLHDILVREKLRYLIVQPVWPAHSRQEGVLFAALLHRHAKKLGTSGGFEIYQLSRRPPTEAPYQVIVLGSPRHKDGLYPIRMLDELDDGPRLGREPLHPWTDSSEGLFEKADALVLSKGAASKDSVEDQIRANFQSVARYNDYQVYLRKKEHSRSKHH